MGNMKFVSNIDLKNNQILNMVVEKRATAPATPVEGQIYYNTTDKTQYLYNGTTWTDTSEMSANEIIAAIKTVDVVTADLDVNKLGGQQGSYYLDRTNHTGTQLAATISDFDTQVQTNRLDQMAAPTADVSMNDKKITNVATPTQEKDAVNKGYVDAIKQGLDPKDSVRIATTENITLSGEQTIDGIDVVAGDRVLVKNQSDAEDNGIYVVDGGAWTRAIDADTSEKVTPGMFTFVEDGTNNADSGFVLSTAGTIVLGTTELTFTKFSTAGQIIGGNGLTKTGNTLDINVDNVGIEINGSDSLQIKDLGVVTAKIADDAVDKTKINADVAGAGIGQNVDGSLEINLGQGLQLSVDDVTLKLDGNTLSLGADGLKVEEGNLTLDNIGGTLGVAKGGTGATDVAGAKTNLGYITRVVQNMGDGTETEYVLTHNFGTKDVVVSIIENSTDDEVFADVQRTSINTVTVKFATAPANNEYRAVIVG